MKDQYVYELFREFDTIIRNFEDRASHYSEHSNLKRKRQLLEKIKKLELYYKKSEFVDRKLEFDQRFFNTGYREFQLMLSDVRAQIQINEDIFKMRELIQQKQNSKFESLWSMTDLPKDDLKAKQVLQKFVSSKQFEDIKKKNDTKDFDYENSSIDEVPNEDAVGEISAASSSD